MNLQTPLAVAALLSLCAAAHAGEVLGKVTIDGAPAREGVTVAARCGARTYAPVGVDKTGSYHLVLDEDGKCTLTVTRQAQSASVDVVSFEDAVQADLVLATEGGKLVARRK